MKKKHKIAKLVAFKDGAFRTVFKKPVINGKLFDASIPERNQMELFNTWVEGRYEWKTRMDMLEQKIREAKTEEEQVAYRKSMQELFQKYTPQPQITKYIHCKMRVKGPSSNGESIVEPAYQTDVNKLRRALYEI